MNNNASLVSCKGHINNFIKTRIFCLNSIGFPSSKKKRVQRERESTECTYCKAKRKELLMQRHVGEMKSVVESIVEKQRTTRGPCFECCYSGPPQELNNHSII
jgi:hypothetical protein